MFAKNTFLISLAAGLMPVTGFAQTVAPQSPRSATMRKTVTRGYLGVGVVELTDERMKALKLGDDHGVEVRRVDENSPASKAGLKENDVILEVNARPVEGIEQFQTTIRRDAAGYESKSNGVARGRKADFISPLWIRAVSSPSAFQNCRTLRYLRCPPLPAAEWQFVPGIPVERAPRGRFEGGLNSLATGRVLRREGRRAGARSDREHSGRKGGSQSRRRGGESQRNAGHQPARDHGSGADQRQEDGSIHDRPEQEGNHAQRGSERRPPAFLQARSPCSAGTPACRAGTHPVAWHSYELPIRTPVANTRIPPSPTCSAAETIGVSI